LSQLADYRQSHGHCNVRRGYSDNTKLGEWIRTQRISCRLHVEGKASPTTLSRIQKLKRLSFEWKPHNSRKKGNPKKPSHDNDTTRVRERAVEALEHVESMSQTQENFSGRQIHRNQVDVPKNPTVMEKCTSPTSRCRTAEI
jgi:hypothetical protein